jgi:hypothetical protein
MKIGDIVELKHAPGEQAYIKHIYVDTRIQGGIRLNRPLENFYSWNVDDLQIVKPQDPALQAEAARHIAERRDAEARAERKIYAWDTEEAAR